MPQYFVPSSARIPLIAPLAPGSRRLSQGPSPWSQPSCNSHNISISIHMECPTRIPVIFPCFSPSVFAVSISPHVWSFSQLCCTCGLVFSRIEGSPLYRAAIFSTFCHVSCKLWLFFVENLGSPPNLTNRAAWCIIGATGAEEAPPRWGTPQALVQEAPSVPANTRLRVQMLTHEEKR